MDKALIEKAFNKFMDTAEPTVDYEVGYLFDDGTAKYFERACLRLWCAGATWQREQLEAEIKQDAHGTHSGNTGGKMDNEKKQYENAVWSSLNKIKELEAEIKELEAQNKTHLECENYVIKEKDQEISRLLDEVQNLLWNLGGISTIISGYGYDFNTEQNGVRPALKDTYTFVIKKCKEVSELQAENKNIREQLIKELREAGEIIKEGLCDYCSDLHDKEKCNLCSSGKYLAKLELLEGEKL